MLKYAIILITLTTTASAWVWNSPYPKDMSRQNIYYSSFSEQPKTLDPAQSYSSNEYGFIAQIYEPPLEYDYKIRPYTLVPLSASKMPEVTYIKENGKVTFTRYRVFIKPGMMYQPHPALAKDDKGNYRYLSLPTHFLEDNKINVLSDFSYQGTREVLADDFIYEIKRLANPATGSPIYGLMQTYINGFKDYALQLPDQSQHNLFVDLRQYPLKGVQKVDDYTFDIVINGDYPQFLYWLTMPFFAPIPWEADAFYGQVGMEDKNLIFSWYPIGSGPFMLAENNPNRRMVLDRNPNYYSHAGMPHIDKAIYILEKEAVPRWNKFLQGYYDLSGIATDNFDEAIVINDKGQESLSPLLKDKGIRLEKISQAGIYYLGFNMRDAVVGGRSERARLLRQAIAIAIDFEENISIFYNGRGSVAQGPIPPGIFGYKEGQEGINPYVYEWKQGIPKRKSLATAKKLMAEAGYSNGIDKKTGKPLILYYDVAVTGGPDDKAQLEWYRKQFGKLGISLNIRGTLYNRFQDKLSQGNAQIFAWGWMADYPDPENFLYGLYGPNSKVSFGGENATNYQQPEFDSLFLQMKATPNGPERQKIIDKMVEIVRHDAPWVFGVNPKVYVLTHDWVKPYILDSVVQNSLKYLEVNPQLRANQQKRWNQAILWPIPAFILLCFLSLLPGYIAFKKRERAAAKRFIS